MNTLFQQLNHNPTSSNNSNKSGGFAGAMQKFKDATPEQQNSIINSLLQKNPQLQTLLSMRGSKSYKDLFFSLAKQRGINPNDILNMFSS